MNEYFRCCFWHRGSDETAAGLRSLVSLLNELPMSKCSYVAMTDSMHSLPSGLYLSNAGCDINRNGVPHFPRKTAFPTRLVSAWHAGGR